LRILSNSLPSTETGGNTGIGSGGSSGGGQGGVKLDYIGTLPTAPSDRDVLRFNDIDDVAWAVDAINVLVANQIIAGYGDGTFRPNNNITREEFVKIIVGAINVYDASAECDFIDVPKDNWSYRYIASMVNAGLINGISEYEFGLGQNITRQDMAVLAYRAAVYKNLTLAEKNATERFDDWDKIADYAIDSVSKLQTAGIINGMGNGNFVPEGLCTRAQAAKVVGMLFFGIE